MENQNSTFVSNIVLDSIRILILISKFEAKKTFKMTIDKIMLYDYYMKFPNTMIDKNTMEINIDCNFYEFYSFYHWKPNIIDYNKVMRYLVAKELVKRAVDKQFYYTATNKGYKFLNELNSEYKNSLNIIANIIKTNIAKMSDGEVEQEIQEKNNVFKRFEGEENGKEI
ncbi:ABC-three component system middle component 2 [Clostridium tagluense]|uniref:Uncharacterized protein n=1 Tax=Clostridium tagluense TaxID=360422 RepID=A0A401UP75_9CLOT|nr:ABC-three component system middle component 2 [Clostridium tagluense]GCD11311.1 hypothetical protein Ctaglu_29340 [Clostridium tagluense]